jgi:hypothetical protein
LNKCVERVEIVLADFAHAAIVAFAGHQIMIAWPPISAARRIGESPRSYRRVRPARQARRHARHQRPGLTIWAGRHNIIGELTPCAGVQRSPPERHPQGREGQIAGESGSELRLVSTVGTIREHERLNGYKALFANDDAFCRERRELFRGLRERAANAPMTPRCLSSSAQRAPRQNGASRKRPLRRPRLSRSRHLASHHDEKRSGNQ